MRSPLMYLLAGGVAGVLAGLFGIGGGLALVLAFVSAIPAPAAAGMPLARRPPALGLESAQVQQ